MIQRMTVIVATLALGLFLAPGLANAAHHEKEEGHGKDNPCKTNPCKGDENPCKANPCKGEEGSDEDL